MNETWQPRDEKPLLLKAKDVCRILGGISSRTLRRLEQRGLVKGIALTRHKLYRREEVERLVEEVASWPL
jgi:predicted site-specific integrase-resolvase